MQHRDLITDEIERMGNVLRMIINRFLNLEPDDNIHIIFNEANKQFSEQFNIQIDDLLTLKSENLTEFVDRNHLTSEHCDKLAHILYVVSKDNELCKDDKRPQYLHTAVEFLNIAEHKTDVLSLERMDLKSKITQDLNN